MTPQEIRDQIKNFDDVLNYHNLTREQFDENNKGLTPDEVGYRKEKLIVSTYNRGKLPDWDNSNEAKYYPWFKMGSSGFRYDDFVDWHALSVVGSRLCFIGEEAYENMIDATEKFLNEYKESRTL